MQALIDADEGESTSGTTKMGPQNEDCQKADCSSNDQREDEGINSSEEEDNEEDEEDKNLTEDLKSLIGKKCRAPFNTEWSMYGTHNAIITDVIDFNPPNPAQVSFFSKHWDKRHYWSFQWLTFWIVYIFLELSLYKYQVWSKRLKFELIKVKI